jgi:hypothetical protein
LFYIWHMESLNLMQQNWLASQQQQQAQQQKSAAPQIETIDLLMKSYSIGDGTEDQDMRAELIRNNHLSLLISVQQQVGVDVSDLIDPAKAFNSAQLYAALLRLKQQHERQQARLQLDKRAQSVAQINTP